MSDETTPTNQPELEAELARERATVHNLDERCALLETRLDGERARADAAIRRAESAEGGRDALIADAQEGATWRKRAELAEPIVTTLRSRVIELEAAKIEAVLAQAAREGKIRPTKDAVTGAPIIGPVEARLRRIATKEGLAALEDEVDGMPQIIPLGRVELGENDPNPRPSHGPIPSSVLASTAEQMGLEPAELEEHAAALAGGTGGRS